MVLGRVYNGAQRAASSGRPSRARPAGRTRGYNPSSVSAAMPLAVALHVLAVVAWVGGMAFALFVLRPGLAALPPPQRVAVLARVFARFLPVVGVAVLVIVASGVALLTQLPTLRGQGWGLHAMIGLGAVMIVIYAFLWWRLNPRLQAAAAAEDWPAGGRVAESMRRGVMVNLVLGVVVIVAAIVGR